MQNLTKLFLSFLVLPLSLLVQALASTSHYVPAKPATGASTVDFLAKKMRFDLPYVSPVNSSVFEWWWFEAVADDLQSTLTVIFFTSTDNGFPLGTSSQVTSVYVTGLLPNGTIFEESLPATGATFTSNTSKDTAVQALWHGAQAQFVGNEDFSLYTVTIYENPSGISGTFKLRSLAPPHYPCSAALTPGQDLQIFPHIGWTNAQPAANATGSMRIGDQTLTFTNALGYHDHNWGDQPFVGLIQSWYWGHAMLGPYTLVWFDGIDSTGNEDVAGYLAMDGQILLSSCTPGSLKVRPVGGAATYPPQMGRQSKFKYLNITVTLGSGKQFVAKAYPQSVNLKGGKVYTRWIGPISGGMVGGTQYQSITAFEEFTLS